MKITFLGTSAAIPSLRRNVSALALQFDQRREWWLFDCGEGTQQQLLKAGLSLAAIERIFISHLHGDHCFGLVGLLATRGMMGGVTLAFVVEEKDRQGHFKLEEAQALGIPPGPIYARLKRGEKFTLPDGREIDGATLVEPPRKGRKLALVFDAKDASGVQPFAQGAELAVHEATYAEADANLAEQNGHSTAAGAARFARAIGAKRLILTHFSPRYDQRAEDGICIADLVREAEAEFAGGSVLAAKDFMQCELRAV